jgi:hypothetical protein
MKNAAARKANAGRHRPFNAAGAMVREEDVAVNEAAVYF